jgi:thiol-disulfide isomerase/thioredoxin
MSKSFRWILAGVGALGLAAAVVGTIVKVEQPIAKSCDTGQKDADGKPVPPRTANLNFTLKDAGGADVPLSRFKGKVLLLDFWATWCEPCKVEIPSFIEFQNKYAGDGLQIVGISIDDTADQLRPYIEKMGMNYPVLQGKDRDDVQDAYGPLVGIPVSVVISRDGKVCAWHAGLTSKKTFESEIKALL